MSNPIRVLQPTSESAAATDSTDLGDLIEKTFRREVEGALRLLDFAVADGRGVPDTVVDTIATTVKNVAPGTVTEYAGFLKAYGQLAALLSPINAITLEATCDKSGRHSILAPWRASEAKIWSRKLWAWTLFFCLLIVVHENATHVTGKDPEATLILGPSWGPLSCAVLATIVPFAYGALGACAYLLRICHQFIHDRCFDPMHTPEYQGRILLGAVGGGTILLLSQYLSGDATKTPLSGAALAFLAGYTNDGLFNLVQRLVAVLMPKDDTGSGQSGRAAG